VSAFDYVKLGAPDYIVACTIATEVPPDAPSSEFKAVTDVIKNRAKDGRWGNKTINVVLAKNQFSAVCREQYWKDALTGDWLPSHVERCYSFLTSGGKDSTDGSLYYFSPVSMVPRGTLPKWDFDKLEEVHVDGVRPEYFRFFKEKP